MDRQLQFEFLIGDFLGNFVLATPVVISAATNSKMHYESATSVGHPLFLVAAISVMQFGVGNFSFETLVGVFLGHFVSATSVVNSALATSKMVHRQNGQFKLKMASAK